MNSKLLSPKWVIDQVVKAYVDAPDQQSLASIEGFVRQIMGWREYVRGIYLSRMPDYTTNGLDNKAATRLLLDGRHQYAVRGARNPANERTRLRSPYPAVDGTGNLALLLGVHPDEVDRWYWRYTSMRLSG